MALDREPRPELLILRALGLGDLLTAVPALRALARAYPSHRRTLLAPAWLKPLLPLITEGGRPCVSRLAEADGLSPDPSRLPQGPDVAVNLHGRGPESHRLLAATEPGRLIAFRNEEVAGNSPPPPGGLARLPEWRTDEHEVARWCRLLNECGIRANPAELGITAPGWGVPSWATGATLIHPGAASASRRWPPRRWRAVVEAELEAGREVVLTGTRSEMGLARKIGFEAGLDPSRDLAGRTSVAGLAALVAAADTVVCGDTGVAHLATALHKPSVLLFGPTPPELWGPPTGHEIHRVIWTGRRGDPHAGDVDAGLLEIEAEAVLAALADQRSRRIGAIPSFSTSSR